MFVHFQDGDLITIADTSDLNLATQRNRLLKVTIFSKILNSSILCITKYVLRICNVAVIMCKRFFVLVKGREILPLVDASVVKDVRKELTLIRDKVNSLLDALDITEKVPSTQPPEQQYHSSTGKDIQLIVIVIIETVQNYSLRCNVIF